VAQIVGDVVNAGRKPVVLGDFNADSSQAKPGKTIQAVTQSKHLIDPFKGLGPKDRWTHYYASGKEVSRLDYVLPHKSLKVVGTDIFRKGLTTKCKQYTGPRFPTIGPEHTEASDHCPTTVILDV
jgi:endonuclease/exonuclease/phosphatase family metal-dependent hydrolase